jgi:ABC-type transporter Mla MlaB component
MAKYCGAYYDGVLRIICTGSPEVVLITGEIDQAHYLGLVSTLEDLVDPEGDVHVNLAGLAYCDVAGLRAILGLAWAGREDRAPHGRSLFLDDVPPELATVLGILGWDCTPGLIMNEPAQFAADSCLPSRRKGSGQRAPSPEQVTAHGGNGTGGDVRDLVIGQALKVMQDDHKSLR